MYKTLVNKATAIELNNNLDTIIQSNDAVSTIKNPNGSFNVFINNELVLADIVEVNEQTKMVTIKINQQKYEVQVQEPADLLLQKVGVKIAEPKKVMSLKSAMPGLVLKVQVQEGQVVRKGDVLLIVEAMKMENLFKATADVTINKINVVEKEIIEKGQELITFI